LLIRHFPLFHTSPFEFLALFIILHAHNFFIVLFLYFS